MGLRTRIGNWIARDAMIVVGSLITLVLQSRERIIALEGRVAAIEMAIGRSSSRPCGDN